MSDEHKNDDEKVYLFDKPKNVSRLLNGFYAICGEGFEGVNWKRLVGQLDRWLGVWAERGQIVGRTWTECTYSKLTSSCRFGH